MTECDRAGGTANTGLQMGSTPGRCELFGTIEENQSGSWQQALTTWPSSTVWGVTVELQTPLPVVKVGLDGKPVEREDYRYTIQPLDYQPETVDVIFEEDGLGIGKATAVGRGDGYFSLQENTIVLSPHAQHSAQPILNLGKRWDQTMTNGNGVELRGPRAEFGVVGVGIGAVFKIIENETGMKVLTDPTSGEKFYRSLGGIRIKLWTEESALATKYSWSATGGEFFEDQYSTTALGGAGLERREIWWEAPPEIGKRWELTLSVEAQRPGGGTGIFTFTAPFKTRLLEVQNPQLAGDDVKMLQSALRMLGFSTVGTYPNWGIGGPAPKVDGQFGSATSTAVDAFQVADALSTTSKVDDATLAALEENWVDYVAAYHRFDSSPTITVNDPRMDQWITVAVNPTASEPDLLKATYTDALHQQVPPEVPYGSVPYNDLIREWIVEEAGLFGHWGRAIPFRVTLGAADEWGSIGFSQIQARYRYSGNATLQLKNINLYDPVGAIKGMGVFSNLDKGGVGGSFYKAFVIGSFKRALPISSFPHIEGSSKYEDTVKDLLTKALGSYNGGTKPDVFDRYAWPQSLQKKPIPKGKRCDTHPDFDFFHAMCYALQIETRAHVGLSCWVWLDESISAGANSICDSVTAIDSRDVDVSLSAGIGHPASEQVCIVASSGDPLYSVPQGDDVLREFSFEYCESDWMNGISWEDVRSQEIAQGVHFVP